MKRNALIAALIPLVSVAAAVWQAIDLNSYDVRPGLITAVVLSTLANGLFAAALIRQGRRTVPTTNRT
ncbi:hypothetical protein ABZY10_11075 [Streptomyces sp. NPDC006539]|uniref:hypothetical protein n=1 Tax=Streptomyces sp. NPDC006539 TaxID=3155352 RepID=UPI0033B4ED40